MTTLTPEEIKAMSAVDIAGAVIWTGLAIAEQTTVALSFTSKTLPTTTIGPRRLLISQWEKSAKPSPTTPKPGDASEQG